MTGRVLVAGVGNIFLGDDGFGVEVARQLAHEPLPASVRVLEAGVRARDLAFEIVDGGYDTAILVDAVSRGGAPGTVYLIEPALADQEPESVVAFDGHSMTPETALAFVHALGGTPARILIVGCEPERLDERHGLSPVVYAAVGEALAIVRSLVCA